MEYILYYYIQKIENFLFSNVKVHNRDNNKMTTTNANVMANAMANVNMNMNVTNNKIFRYKLSDNIMELITQFAKIHQYDDRHAYKEAWENYVNEKREIIDREVYRLSELNYKGDVMDKMFKAGRYYFRAKGVSSPNDENSAALSNPSDDDLEHNEEEIVMGGRNPHDDDDPNAVVGGRNPNAVVGGRNPRSYIVMHPDVIQSMDKHLISIIKNANFKPAQGFIQFCNQHIDLLREEITRLTSECSVVGMTSKTLADKIKKTYKNRYFMLKQVL